VVTMNERRSVLVLSSLVITFIVLRFYLHLFPSANFDVGSYNIHHLFTGLLLITFAGLPLVLFEGSNRALDVAAVIFGVGLSMALDEWVYLIVTDGSDTSYLLPVSLWGGVVMIGLASIYIITLVIVAEKMKSSE
jgi:hypothetical protein